MKQARIKKTVGYPLTLKKPEGGTAPGGAPASTSTAAPAATPAEQQTDTSVY